jgi:hypothetical protein
VWEVTRKLTQRGLIFIIHRKSVLDDLVANRRIIKMDVREIRCCGMDWIHPVQCGDVYQDLTNTTCYFRVQKHLWNFLKLVGTVSLEEGICAFLL